MKRTATAHWQGSGKDGKGNLSTQSEVLSQSPYSYVTRFENEKGTNPEELVAAAHAGCFTMKLSFLLSGAGFIPDELHTQCEITLEDGSITQSHLTLTAKVKGIEKQNFDDLVKNAKANCPISKLLNTNIILDYTLDS